MYKSSNKSFIIVYSSFRVVTFYPQRNLILVHAFLQLVVYKCSGKVFCSVGRTTSFAGDTVHVLTYFLSCGGVIL